MNPTTLLTMIVLVATTEYLVHFLGWDPLRAGFVVGLSCLLFVLSIFAVILPFIKREERQEFWNVVFSTAKNDLVDLYNLLRFKR